MDSEYGKLKKDLTDLKELINRIDKNKYYKNTLEIINKNLSYIERIGNKSKDKPMNSTLKKKK